MRSTYIILLAAVTGLVLSALGLAACAAPPADRSYVAPVGPRDAAVTPGYDAGIGYDSGYRPPDAGYDAGPRDAAGYDAYRPDTGSGGGGGLPFPIPGGGGGGGGIPGGGGMGMCTSDADCESGEVCCGIDALKICIGIPICPL